MNFTRTCDESLVYSVICEDHVGGFSPIIIAAALVFDEMTLGMMLLSAIRRPDIPRSRAGCPQQPLHRHPCGVPAVWWRSWNADR